jgi:hypothetical protein
MAAEPRVSGTTFILCVREALEHDAEQGVPALPALLRMRPELPAYDLATLLHKSAGPPRSVRTFLQEVESGALRWDARALLFRPAE